MCLEGTAEVVRTRAEREGLPLVSRRALLGAGAGAAVTATLPGKVAGAAQRPSKGRVTDLTHVFTQGFPVYTGDTPVRSTIFTIEDNGFYSQAWTFGEHSGTHVDAPGHFVTGGRLTPELTPRELVAPAAVVDISARAARDPDATVTVSDLVRFEERHGRIPRSAVVFMYSGWEQRISDPEAYKNTGSDGLYHFPGFGIDALEWLLERRSIGGIGVDTLSLDPGNSTTFDVHLTLLGADRYGIENVANLKRIPPRGATAYVGVIPWEEGSGGPCRLLATF